MEDLKAFISESGFEGLMEALKRWDAPAEARRAQAALLPPSKDITYRDEANAIVLRVLRDGFIEDLHSGRSSPLLLDADCSRITQGEMKRLMIETSARLATWLRKRDKALGSEADPRAYLTELLLTRGMFTNHWERGALTSSEADGSCENLAQCGGCHAPLDEAWRYCPCCGVPCTR